MGARYSILRLDLTTAGSQVIEGPFALMRFVSATDAGGDLQLLTLVKVQVENEGEQVSFRVGNGFRARPAARRWIISWTAQAGVTAEFLFSNDDGQVDIHSDPPAQVIGNSLTITRGQTIRASKVTVGAAAVQLLAADATRRRVHVKYIYLGATAAIFLGKDNTVTTANGYAVEPGDVEVIEGGAALWAIGESAGLDVRLLEELD
jgi:hypothetical protein